MVTKKKDNNKLGQSPWKTTKPMSPVTKKNQTPQPNDRSGEPRDPGKPTQKGAPGGGRPSKSK